MKKEFNVLQKEFKVNDKIEEKIESSDLPKPIKQFLMRILRIEFSEGKGAYSPSYKKAVEETAVLLEK